MNYSDKFGSASFQEISSSSLSQKGGFDFTALGAAQQTTHGSVIIDDAHLLFAGQYKRDGLNLVISNDENKIIVPDYFKSDTRATLSTRDGATLSGKIVDAFTGYVAYAQAGGQADPPKEIGTVQKLTGTATAIRNGVSVQLNVGDKVYKSDVLESGAGSSLGVIFIDGTVFSLSSSARMVLNEMVYDPNGSSNSSLLSLVQGTITFVAGQTAKNGNMRVDTPVATMGIRGTTVLVKISSEDGTVKLSVERDPNGAVGSFVIFDKNGNPIGSVSRVGDVTTIRDQAGVPITDSTTKTQTEKVADLLIIQQVFQAFFPDIKQDPNNANPGRQGNNGSGSLDPRSELARAGGQGTTTVNGVPVVVPTGNGPSSTTVGATVLSPPVIITPVADFQAPDGQSTSFTIGGQVAPDPLIIPYIANSGRISGSQTTAPVPNGFALTALVHLDAGTGTVTYNPEDFRFLALGETATYQIIFQTQSGPFIQTQTISFTVDGLKDAPIYTASNFGVDVDEPLGADAVTLFYKDGELRFNDADFSDVASGYTVATTGVVAMGRTIGLPNNAALLNMLQFTGITKAVGTTLGVISEKFSAAASVFDYLAVGEQVSLVYSIKVTDLGGDTNTSTLTVTITGTNDIPTITGATSTSGNLTEDVGAVAASGIINFRDVDLSDDHEFSWSLVDSVISAPIPGFTPATSLLHSFELTPTEDNTDDINTGTVGWTYTLDNAVAQWLAAGQTITLTYGITIDDGHGDGVATQDIVVIVTGTNDAPVITAATTAASTSGAVTEDAVAPTDLTASGSITFQDLDLIDTHTATFVLTSSDAIENLPGYSESAPLSQIGTFALTAETVDALTGRVVETADPINTATIGWSFTLADNDPVLQSLAEGQTITQVYTVTIDDGHTGTTTQDVTITITGTNDTPVLTAVVIDGAVGEDDAVQAGNLLKDTGSVTFADVDVTDHETASVAFVGNATTSGATIPAALYDALQAALTLPDTSFASNTGTVNWAFALDNALVQYLADGETVTATYEIVVQDDSGVAASDTSEPQIITITITGTNDAPVITSDAQSGAVTEDIQLTATGQVTSSDVDHNATATYSGNATGDYGSFVIDSATGIWAYTLDNANHQSLAQGESHTETFLVTVTDDQNAMVTQQIVVTVNGINDVPMVGSPSINYTDTAADDTFNNAGGTFFATDPDGGPLTWGISDGVVADTLVGEITYNVSKTTPYGTLFVNNATGQWLFQTNDAGIEGITSDVMSSITVTVSDSIDTTDMNFGINLTGTNDAPSIDLDSSEMGFGYASSLVADGNTLPIALQPSVFDIDGTTIAGATVVLTNGGGLGDFFYVPDGSIGPLSWAISGTAGNENDPLTLTFSGPGTHADYANAIAQVSFGTTSTVDGERLIYVQLNDGETSNNLGSISVASIAVSQPVDNGNINLDSASYIGVDPDLGGISSLLPGTDGLTLTGISLDSVTFGSPTSPVAGVYFNFSATGIGDYHLSVGTSGYTDAAALIAAIEANEGNTTPLTDTFYYRVTDGAGGYLIDKITYELGDLTFTGPGSEPVTYAPPGVSSLIPNLSVNDWGFATNGASVITVTVQVSFHNLDFGDLFIELAPGGVPEPFIEFAPGAITLTGTQDEINASLATVKFEASGYGSADILLSGTDGPSTTATYIVGTISSAPASIALDEPVNADPSSLWIVLNYGDLQPDISPTHLSVQLDLPGPALRVDVDARYLTYTVDGDDQTVITGGVVTGLHFFEYSDTENDFVQKYEITGLSIRATEFYDAVGPNADDALDFLDLIASHPLFVTGTGDADGLFGGDRGDIIDTHGGADIVHAGDGNDLIIVHDDNQWFVDGGAGIDTLRASGSFIAGVVSPGSDGANLEIFDLNTDGDDDGGAVSILIDGEGASTLNHLGPAGTGLIRILGDDQDTVRFDDQFDGHPNGAWVAGTGADLHVLYTGDFATDGVYFNKYFYVDGADTLATAYVQEGIAVDLAPVLNADSIRVFDSVLGDGVTTVFDFTVTDHDELSFPVLTASADNGTLSPSLINDNTVEGINEELSFELGEGVIYTPNDYNPGVLLNDIVTLTVTDSHGLSDSLHFVFQQSGPGGATLIGTAGKDIIFSTGGDDTLTGGAGRDNFVFSPESGSPSNADTITDFESGIDRIDIRQFAEVDSGNIGDWLAAHTTTASGDTLIEFDVGNSILLKNVPSLTMNDFILHPA